MPATKTNLIPKVSNILEAKINKLYDLRVEIKSLQDQEKELSESIITELQSQGLDNLSTPKVSAKLSLVEKLAVNVRKFKNSVSEHAFLNSVTISINRAREYLGEHDLRRISEVSHHFSLRLNPVKK